MVEYIEIKGKNYPIRIGYFALKNTSKEMEQKNGNGKKLKIEDLIGDDIEVYEPLLYYSLVQGAKITDQDMDFERDDMEWVLDLVMMDFVSLIPKFFPTAEEAGMGKSITLKEKKVKK